VSSASSASGSGGDRHCAGRRSRGRADLSQFSTCTHRALPLGATGDRPKRRHRIADTELPGDFRRINVSQCSADPKSPLKSAHHPSSRDDPRGGDVHDWKQCIRRHCNRGSARRFRRPRDRARSGPLARCRAPLQPERGQSGLSPPDFRQSCCGQVVWFCARAGPGLACREQLPQLLGSGRVGRARAAQVNGPSGISAEPAADLANGPPLRNPASSPPAAGTGCARSGRRCSPSR